MMQKEPVIEHCIKIFVLGDSGVGKSSLLSKFTTGEFPSNYKRTLGIDFYCKVTNVLKQTVKLHLWDTAGESRFSEVIKDCLPQAQAALICFDVTNPQSVDKVPSLIKLFRTASGKPDAPIVLIGCKTDLIPLRVIDCNAAQKIAKEQGVNYVEVSASTNSHVDEAFTTLAEQLLLQPTLNKIMSLLLEYYENYLKLHSQQNTPGFFAPQLTVAESLLQNNYAEILLTLFPTTHKSELIDYYTATQRLIKDATALHAHENPYLSRLVHGPLTKMLHQSLNCIDSFLPEIKELVTNNLPNQALCSIKNNQD